MFYLKERLGKLNHLNLKLTIFSRGNVFKREKRSFTIFELLVVISLIAILSAAVMFGWKPGEKNLALQRATHKLSQDLAKTREMAMGAGAADCGGGIVSNSFGIQFKSSWDDHYVLFADCNSNHQKDGADKIVETIYLEKSVTISGLSPANSFSIIFAPPDPIVYINGGSSKTALITLSNGSKTMGVSVNSVGRIETQ